MALNISKQYDLIDARPVKWDDEGKITLLIAPLSTKGYQDAMNAFARRAEAQRKAHQAGFRRGVRDDEWEEKLEKERTEVARRAAAEHLIRGWSGVQDAESGEEVAYTVDLGFDLLGDDVFLVEVIAAAGQLSEYRRDRVDASSKNSKVPSGSGAGSESTTKRRGASS